MHTNQSVFNKVWNVFIVKETPQSISKDSIKRCLYSNKTNGYGCGIGCCIINQRISNLFDNQVMGSITAIKTSLPKEYGQYFANCDIKFLTEIQMWHDDDGDEEDLLEIARQWNLAV